MKRTRCRASATSTARLEVSQEQHAVGAPVSGRIVHLDVEVGRRVKAGEVLFELDAEVERLAMAQEEVRLAPAVAQIAALKQERQAQEQALVDERRTALSGIAEAEARARQAASASTFAAEEAARISALHGRGLVSELEALNGGTSIQPGQRLVLPGG